MREWRLQKQQTQWNKTAITADLYYQTDWQDSIAQSSQKYIPITLYYLHNQSVSLLKHTNRKFTSTSRVGIHGNNRRIAIDREAAGWTNKNRRPISAISSIDTTGGSSCCCSTVQNQTNGFPYNLPPKRKRSTYCFRFWPRCGEGCMPASQKCAIITPLLKKLSLDSGELKNYRPVSNLTFMSKAVDRREDRCCADRWVGYLQANDVMPRLQ